MPSSLTIKSALAFTLIISAAPIFAAGTYGGNVKTLASCLQSIKRGSGQSLKIQVDKPDQVIGHLSRDGFFSCTRKESGTKGVYWEGRYTTTK